MIDRSEEIIEDDINKKNFDQLICLTLYNEESFSLINTLVSIAKNINNQSSSKKTVIAIIADGEDRVAESSKELLSRLGLVSQLSTNDSDDSLDCETVTLPATKIVKACGADITGIEYSKTLTISLYTKKKNSGKLDSHWWFFKKIAPLYKPEFCYQIDAGTILQDDAIANMRSRFDLKPRAAALASNVLIKSKSEGDLLEAFQVGDFAVQKSIVWPSDSLLGYLSVVPGQFCGFRYSAITNRSEKVHQSPVDKYLRGMKCNSAFEKTMFLAEDRVMGFEIIAHEGSDNRLEYCEDSICYTDECSNVKEFLGQRRRWVNSAFMCRTWMMASIGRYFKDSSSSLMTKCHTGLSLSSMVSSHLLELFQPLINFLVLFASYFSLNKVFSHHGIDDSITNTVFILIVLLWTSPTFLSIANILQKQSVKTVNRLLQTLSFVVFFLLIINLYATAIVSFKDIVESPLLIHFSIFSSCVWLGAIMLGRYNLKALSKSFFQYYLLCLPVNLMMFSYSFINLDDSSWGTKGLDRSNEHSENQLQSLSSKLKKFRFNFVLFWLVVNLSAITMAVHYQWVYSLLIFSAILTLFISVTGLLGMLFLNVRAWLAYSLPPEFNDHGHQADQRLRKGLGNV